MKMGFQLLCLLLMLLYSPSSAKLCSRYQTSILLQFKELFSLETLQSFPHSKMISWKDDNDCCSWDGVTCDMVTGQVIGLNLSSSGLRGYIPSNSSLFSLSHLQNLDLASNNFSSSHIPSGFTRFSNLTHLNLSFSSFSGQIPAEISHLSKLVSLDLSDNFELSLDTPVLEALVQNLTELQELVLNSIDMSNVVPSSLTNLSSSLTTLSLQSSGLQGYFPKNIFSLPNLQTLSLSYNKNLTSVFPQDNWSSPLRFLDIYYCSFMGSIPESLGNLSQLIYLDLSSNNFSGHIPETLSNLEQLRHFGISDNKCTGQIPDMFANLRLLLFLDFSNNQLSGPIPSTVSQLQSLAIIYLSYNSLNGTIPPKSFTSPSLELIDLSHNQLTGSISSSISELQNLTQLSLSSNNLSGNIELHMFAKLKNLLGLDLSHNNLSLSTELMNSSFPKLSMLGLSSCNISEFPDFLRTQNRLQWLDLSQNQIRGGIPHWIWNTGRDTLNHLNLSYNFLTSIEQLPWKNLRYLDLRSNLLQGSLPFLPPSMTFISVSNNKLSGEITSSFCNMISIFYLDLSKNSLSGTIPQCFANSSFMFLDLRMNNFHGSIPQTFSQCSRLAILNLNGNQLEGPLPPSLLNCRNLEVLDVGNNKINDTFPLWLAAMSELQVLILRSNQFHGSITYSNITSPFSMLRILDLSSNEFTGVLPTRYFQNFHAMVRGDNNNAEAGDMYINYGNEYYSAILTVKGVNMEMERVLNIFTIIDLSGNRFQGRIPEMVGKLNSLKGLNFSHNYLTGPIPSSLENLTELESLDLSSNKLVGKIPMQLTSLNFLQVLNLSQNQLVGPIPGGKQFNTFSTDSFRGNLGLCGFPLSEQCRKNEVTEPVVQDQEEGDTQSSFDWKLATMGYGSGLVIGLSMGYFVFSTGRPKWLVRMVEREQTKKVMIKILKQGGRRRRN